jgi:orotidine-5'-phosphate decarboxylase
MKFIEKLEEVCQKNNSLVCVGLDTELSQIPQFLLAEKDPIFEFNKRIIDATSGLVCAYKPNMAFYEALGLKGLEALRKTCEYIPENIITIIDAKRGDIGNTAKMYAKAFFEDLKADAVTVNPYMGEDALTPFLEYEEKCAFILCLTSNPGAKDFQFLNFQDKLLYEIVAEKVVSLSKKKNCGLVVGATQSSQMRKIREIAPDLPFLIPGIGAQGGDVEMTIKFGTDERGNLAIINSARKIIYASKEKDFAQKAKEETKKLKEEINLYRQK